MNGIHEVTGSIPVWSTNLQISDEDRIGLADVCDAVSHASPRLTPEPVPGARTFIPLRVPPSGQEKRTPVTAGRPSRALNLLEDVRSTNYDLIACF